MLTIYAIPLSLYCAKLRILLRHKGLQWHEEAPPGGYGSEAYKEIIPSGNLPALIDGDLVLADSEAIAEYLEEKHPDPPMLPADMAARAKVREGSRFHDTRLEPALRKLFPEILREHRDTALAQRQSREISARLDQLATLLQTPGVDPAAGPTLRDCGFPITFTWIEALTPVLDLGIHWPDAVVAYRRTIEGHATIAAELAEYRPKLADWLPPRRNP